MAAMRVKIRVDSWVCDDIEVTILMGKGPELVEKGTLMLQTEEYQMLGAALGLGSQHMMGHLVVEHDDRVFLEESNRRAAEEQLTVRKACLGWFQPKDG